MKWSITGYILWKYSERFGRRDVMFRDFAKFVFEELGRRQKVFFHESSEDLQRKLKLLANEGHIELETFNDKITKIKVRESLKNSAKALEDFVERENIGLMKEYLERIDTALKELTRKKNTPPRCWICGRTVETTKDGIIVNGKVECWNCHRDLYE